MWTVFSFPGILGSSSLHKKILLGHRMNELVKGILKGILISTIQCLMRLCKYVQFVNT